MISRWLISFSLFVGLIEAVTITGSVSLVNSREAVVKSGNDFSGVVVWLEPVNASARAVVRQPMRAEIVQKNKRFTPHILVIPTGATVDFPNFDPIFHNAFSNFEGKVFDIGLYAPGTSRSVRFDRPGVVRVFCNIHPTMSAIIVVLGTPYFTTSRADGRYQINNVPPGEYTLHVLHERATSVTLDSLRQRIAVREREPTTALAPITISESGYIPRQHPNKYGKPYPPPPEDSFYPGARK